MAYDDEINEPKHPASPETWEHVVALDRVKRKADLGDGAYAIFIGQGTVVEIPLEEWHQMGRPNMARLVFTDGGVHAPVGA